MKPRKFVGASSRDVLRQVRDALGPDALILSNAKVAGGIEVVAMPSSSIHEIVSGAVNEEPVPDPIYTQPVVREKAPKEGRAVQEPSFLRRLTSREPRAVEPPVRAPVMRDEPPAERAPAERTLREAAPDLPSPGQRSPSRASACRSRERAYAFGIAGLVAGRRGATLRTIARGRIGK